MTNVRKGIDRCVANATKYNISAISISWIYSNSSSSNGCLDFGLM